MTVHIEADATAGPVVVTLPYPVAGALITVEKIDDSPNSVTVSQPPHPCQEAPEIA